MKSRDRTESYAQPCCGADRRLHLDSALAAARSKHSARLQRKLKALVRDLSLPHFYESVDDALRRIETKHYIFRECCI
jgi:hypothetical protein